MWEVETDCYIGANRLAYSNKRKHRRGDWPIDVCASANRADSRTAPQASWDSGIGWRVALGSIDVIAPCLVSIDVTSHL